MSSAPDHHHIQRLKVGAVGLAIVVVLIVIAGAILGSVARQRPAVAGQDSVTNMAVANTGAAEPLAELGVAPAHSETKAAR